MLRKHERVVAEFSNYLGDADKQLKGLAFSKHGFLSRRTSSYIYMHVGKECYTTMKTQEKTTKLHWRMVFGFWTGTLPDELKKTTVSVERSPVYPVRVKVHTIA